MKKFTTEYIDRGIKEVSFPRLGCGNGNLDWDDVRPLMEHYLKDIDIDVYIHDYTVDIGLPEHLDTIARSLRLEGVWASTFDAFLAAMRRAAELSAGSLVDLETGAPFSANMDDKGNLAFKSGAAEWVVERDDLRGVWLSLLSGLVTKSQAGWSTADGGDALLSMLSVLPQVRPIQIESLNKAPQLAIELILSAAENATASEQSEQSQFTWA